MQRTTGATQALTIMAGTAMGSGLAVVTHGTLRSNLAHTVGGTCVTLAALTVIALILIHRWIVDTSQERRRLGAAQDEADQMRSKYVAAQAALEIEQGRLTKDRAAQVHADAVRLKVERQAMAAEFEERRAALIAETMEATVAMIQSGKMAPDEPTRSKVIEFPRQQPQRQPQRERSREHGVVGP